MRTSALLLCSLLSASLAGCAGARCPARPFTAAAPALARARALRSAIHTLRAEARVDQRGEEGRIRGTVLMMVEPPDRLRFDAMTQFGPAAVLTSDGAAFELLDQREGRFLSGRSCPSNIARLLGVALSGEELAMLLRGDSPRLEGARESITCQGSGRYLVRLETEGGERQELEYDVPGDDLEAPPDAQRLRLRRSERFDADGHRLFRVTYDDYRAVEAGDGAVFMPFAVHFEAHGADTLVRFRHVEVGVELDGSLFRQEAPPSMPVETVECAAN